MDRLLQQFENTFRGQPYKHRVSHTGDVIASCLYEDLLTLKESAKFVERIIGGRAAVNTSNIIKGKKGRRGDGTFGRLIPGEQPAIVSGFSVLRGLIANLEIGAEVKIIATKMTAQIDRVMNDLIGQADVFRGHSKQAITIAIIGVNHADIYTGYEGDRSFEAKTPPGREAPEIVRRIESTVRPRFDELLILRFRATNRPPFPFEWVDLLDTQQQYRSILVRVSNLYDQRF